MPEKLEIYKCELCGNIVEVLAGGGAELICCGDEMVLLDPKTADAATEKHVPIIEKIDGGYKVVVGSTPHPMEPEHYIQWIELTCGDLVAKTYMNPGDKPEATFYVGECCEECGPPTAREYCNVHGLWKGVTA